MARPNAYCNYFARTTSGAEVKLWDNPSAQLTAWFFRPDDKTPAGLWVPFVPPPATQESVVGKLSGEFENAFSRGDVFCTIAFNSDTNAHCAKFHKTAPASLKTGLTQELLVDESIAFDGTYNLRYKK
ncbi:hypothetical protein MKEN_00270600 [Mycena kentingensis (nom. inval.)]|nr:hypothetical protein MKEN_00270600 [Mycena kentingensis (nom. inval.)]